MYEFDLAVFGKSNELVLVVEVLKSPKPGPEWAIHTRRNLLAHGILPKSRYFLIASPERFYLWKSPREEDLETPPDYEWSFKSVLNDYLRETGISKDSITGSGFEFVVYSWLSELMANTGRLDKKKCPKEMIQSGLLKDLRNGSLEREVRV